MCEFNAIVIVCGSGLNIFVIGFNEVSYVILELSNPCNVLTLIINVEPNS